MDRLKADQPIERPADEPPATDEFEAPPPAFLPITPFGDGKPYAGSLLDPTGERSEEQPPGDDAPPPADDAVREPESRT